MLMLQSPLFTFIKSCLIWNQVSLDTERRFLYFKTFIIIAKIKSRKNKMWHPLFWNFNTGVYPGVITEEEMYSHINGQSATQNNACSFY